MVLCIVKTQLPRDRVENLASTLGYDNAFAISSSGRSGGLGIFWNNEIKIENFSYSAYHIDAHVTMPGAPPWRRTVMYGEAKVSDRGKTWHVLRSLAEDDGLPWVCFGDYNEVLSLNEHDGIGHRCMTQVNGFRDAVDTCGLIDLGFSGNIWTFEKRVAGGTYTRVRLDRALATASWSSMYLGAELSHKCATTSDHIHILLQLSPADDQPRQARPFRYEMMWESHEGFQATIEQHWQGPGATTVAELCAKIKTLSTNLKHWDRTTFGSVKEEIRSLKLQLESMRADPSRTAPTRQEEKVKDRLIELYHREDVMWRQRSRITWLAAGDKNTKFFHLRASRRRLKNKIKCLLRHDGTTVEDAAEMECMVTDFYKNMFTSEGTTNMHEVIDVVP